MRSKKSQERVNTPFVLFLQQIFDNRKQRNTKYSLRAFARDLQIAPSKLSEIFSGKFSPGEKMTARLIASLRLMGEEAQHLHTLVSAHRMIHQETRGARVLSEDEFTLIADLENYNVLSLMDADNFVSNASWIADRLNLKVSKVEETLARLQRLGLIIQDSRGWRPMNRRLTTTSNIPSAALLKSHRQVLLHVLESLEEHSVDERDITSITLAIDTSKLPEAKKMIREFRRKMATLLESGNKTEVYNFNLQLVPVTKLQRG